jgi:hypothetical protein
MKADQNTIFTRRWQVWVLLLWAAAAATMIYGHWNLIRWFSLLDTDDNLRIAQVRALLAGQDWYDLRQYKLNPPFGANIHWSRLVDLPIAGIKLALSPLIGGVSAEKAAVAIAPLLPMLVAMLAMAAAVRRLVSPKAFVLGAGLLLCAQSTLGMWMPLRIDHHGWQLAMLSLVVLGLVDRKSARGGIIVGLATAVSLAIGLEMLLYLALAGVIIGLRWVHGRTKSARLAAYGASLAGGSALGYLLFTSYANRAPVCDALSPIWLSVMVTAGALGVLLTLLSPASRWSRLAAAGAVAALIVAGYIYFWPNCIGRLERASPELDQLWLSHVREALPIYKHKWQTIVSSTTLPLIGLVGYAIMLWRSRQDEVLFILWASIAALGFLAAALLLWQTRAGPAAQLLAVPGIAGLAFLVISWFQARSNLLVRVLGTAGAFLLLSGLAVQLIAPWISHASAKNGARALINAANARCPSLPALRPIALLPKGNILTHVDLGPRLIAVTPHTAIAGPYHRNQADIIAVMRAFRGSAENARRTIVERKIDYVLICPNMSETTIYRADAPKGFYVQLVKGQTPTWLEPIELPTGSPYRMWRVK